jgi:hypothetical protein
MASKGFRGYPVATLALYGPDDKRASKVAVGIVAGKDQEPVALERWFSDVTDVRKDKQIQAKILEFLEVHKPKSVVATDRIIGCPHEEVKDYPEGESCPMCPYWADKDRFTHEPVQ